MKLVWDENKRKINLQKHGMDFWDADLVLKSAYRMDLDSIRNGENRVQVFAYVFEALSVLTVVYVTEENHKRIISFRPANRSEREVYYEWLENDINHH